MCKKLRDGRWERDDDKRTLRAVSLHDSATATGLLVNGPNSGKLALGAAVLPVLVGCHLNDLARIAFDQ